MYESSKITFEKVTMTNERGRGANTCNKNLAHEKGNAFVVIKIKRAAVSFQKRH